MNTTALGLFILHLCSSGVFGWNAGGWTRVNVPTPSQRSECQSRRKWLASSSSAAVSTVASLAFVAPVDARAPGSRDVTEALQQIVGAAQDLQLLLDDWDKYSRIDAEGRAGGTDGARRILGGIAPQAGQAAIDVAKSTPLYRIDGAFVAVRQAALEGSEQAWADHLDLGRFEELVERILFAIQKADGDMYSVLFAAKGTKQIDGIFKEAKAQVQQGILDFNEMIGLLKDAGAPILLPLECSF